MIEEVLGDTPRGVRARVIHGHQRLEAEVVGERARVEAEIGRRLIVEFGFTAVRSWRSSASRAGRCVEVIATGLAFYPTWT